jgi:hypothetical protein
MEHHPSLVETPNSNAEDDDIDDIAFAAEAAANAVAAADAEQQRLDESLLSCRICGSGSAEGRPILRFLPVEHDMAAATAAPSVLSFTEDVALHIFCGKTASILPSVNQPELEILTKAGLKNKHGIGPEVNAALARTRCAILQQDGAKEKHYYLVREFEAHLAAIRHTHITFVSDTQSLNHHPNPNPNLNHHHANPNQNQNQNHHPYSTTSTATTTTTTHNPADRHLTHHHHHHHHMGEPTHLVQEENSTMTMTVPLQQQADNNDHFCSSDFSPPPSSSSSQKPLPVRAATGMIHKTGRSSSSSSSSRAAITTMDQQQLQQQHQQQQQQQQQHLATMTEEGKVRCGCGGTHWPLGTARGAASWRSHVMTKRHQKWMEANGLLGAV